MSDVLDEHYDYLSLENRAEFYEEAIAKVVKPGDVVADLGCGFGVLGLQCLKAGASHVYGVDSSGAIYIARESIARAGLADRYTCIAGSSYLNDLPQKVDLVICDHVGWFGFDYDMIPMLEDARARLLKPDGALMPNRLRICMAGSSAAKPVQHIGKWTEAPVPQEYGWLAEYQRNTKMPHEHAAREIATDTLLLDTLDLAGNIEESFKYSGTLTATRDTSITGLAGWFEVELADGVWMTNSPLAKRRIPRNQVFLAASEPFDLRAGESFAFTLRFRKEGALIAWTITPPEGKRQKLSTWNSMIFGDGDLATPQLGPASLNKAGQARRIILQLADGSRSGADIEEAVLAEYPGLYPTEAAIRRFVRAELARSTQC